MKFCVALLSLLFFSLDVFSYTENCDRALDFTEIQKLKIVLQLIETDLHSKPALQSTANMIHGIWQKTNSYRTRYKNMVDEKGENVTNISNYISDHNIPPEVRIHYKKSSDGSYQEDIKYIDNSKLSSINAKENYIGSKYCLKQIAGLMRSLILKVEHKNKITVQEIVEDINKTLQNIHKEWLSRKNKRLQSRQKYPTKIYEMPPGMQYNNFAIFDTLIKKYIYQMDHTSSLFQLIKTSLLQVNQQLLSLVLAPYENLPPGEAYLKMSQDKGTKASLGHESIYNHFDSSLKMTKIKTREIDTISTNEDRENLKQQHQNLLRNELIQGVSVLNDDASDLELMTPHTDASSGAIVYLVRKISTEETVAILKIQSRKSKGLEEVLSTLALNAHLQSDQDIQNFPIVLNYGKINSNDYYLLTSAAHEKDVDNWLRVLERSSSDTLILKVARALAKLHGPFVDAIKKEDLRTFQGNNFYDIKSVRQVTNYDEDDIFKVGLERQDLSPDKAQFLRSLTESAVLNYENIVEANPLLLGPTLIHGDLHGGNLFYNSKNKNVVFIDYSSMSFFLSHRNSAGTGDRGNDIGRKVAHFFVEGLKDNQTLVDSRRKAKVFLQEYIELTKPSPENKDAFLKSALFYSLKYLIIQAKDLNGNKFKSQYKSLKALRQGLFELWEEINNFYKKVPD